jgi:hypothetical protein
MRLLDNPLLVNALNHLQSSWPAGRNAEFFFELLDRARPVPAVFVLRQLEGAGLLSAVPSPVQLNSTLTITEFGRTELAAAIARGVWFERLLDASKT